MFSDFRKKIARGYVFINCKDLQTFSLFCKKKPPRQWNLFFGQSNISC